MRSGVMEELPITRRQDRCSLRVSEFLLVLVILSMIGSLQYIVFLFGYIKSVYAACH